MFEYEHFWWASAYIVGGLMHTTMGGIMHHDLLLYHLLWHGCLFICIACMFWLEF